jgi:hypothetical protein
MMADKASVNWLPFTLTARRELPGLFARMAPLNRGVAASRQSGVSLRRSAETPLREESPWAASTIAKSRIGTMNPNCIGARTFLAAAIVERRATSGSLDSVTEWPRCCGQECPRSDSWRGNNIRALLERFHVSVAVRRLADFVSTARPICEKGGNSPSPGGEGRGEGERLSVPIFRLLA